MRKIILTSAAVAMLTAAAPAPRPATADDLGWMAGNWQKSDEGGWSEEYWAQPRGGMLIGYGRSGKKSGTASFEHLRIAPDADGVLTYWAAPGGGAATAFRLTQSGDHSATFDAPDHDYPQRIRYRRDGDTMTATISLIDDSRAISWEFRRR